MKHHPEIRAVIHLSSTAVHTAVGYADEYGKKTKIMAVGVANTDSFFGGQINNRQHLLSAVYKSVREAIDMAGLEVFNIGISFASPSMIGENCHEQGYISKSTVNVDDVRHLLDISKAKVMQKQRHPVQLCTQLCWLDNKQGVKDAIGMRAKELAVGHHLISMPKVQYEQVADLLISNDLEIHPCLFDGVAGAHYALTEDEKERGVCFIDIGAGTTKVCVYSNGVLLHSCCVAVGGQMVDMDIASELKISPLEAESLKKAYGSAYADDKPKGEFITFKKRGGGELTINTHELASIIQARYQALLGEIFGGIIDKNLIDFVNAGVVLAGGASHMTGLPTLIEQVFNFGVRKMAVNNRVSVCIDRLSDDNIKLLNSYLQDNKLHSVIGALMYQQSEQYARDERSQYDVAQPVGVWAKMIAVIGRRFEYLKQWL